MRQRVLALRTDLAPKDEYNIENSSTCVLLGYMTTSGLQHKMLRTYCEQQQKCRQQVQTLRKDLTPKKEFQMANTSQMVVFGYTSKSCLQTEILRT